MMFYRCLYVVVFLGFSHSCVTKKNEMGKPPHSCFLALTCLRIIMHKSFPYMHALVLNLTLNMDFHSNYQSI